MKIKICCIKSIEEANMALRYGADALGLVGPMPSGPGPIDLETVRKISQSLPQSQWSFYLTSKMSFEHIAEEYEYAQTTHLQITDYVEPNVHEALRKEFPELKIVQVIHVEDNQTVKLAMEYTKTADFLLLDSGAPSGTIKELGGTGRKHDWILSKEIVQKSSVPVFLAGGIKAENVREAMEFVNPYGIDLCSGVRINDVLNEKKLNDFFDKARS